MRLLFEKYEGTGNDFLLLDGRLLDLSWSKDLVIRLCDRRRGIGADGILVVEANLTARYYNADGSEGFCGNGARCVATWARKANLTWERFRLGQMSIRARFDKEMAVYWSESASVIPMPDGYFVDGQTPHLVCEVDDLNTYPVETEGRKLRQDAKRFPLGVNVNFIAKKGNLTSGFSLRTYERGVEAETLSCGTGVVAAARVLARQYGVAQAFIFHTLGGRLQVGLRDPLAGEVMLQGAVRSVYDGHIEIPTPTPKPMHT